jgi:hypothetical protein
MANVLRFFISSSSFMDCDKWAAKVIIGLEDKGINRS